MAATKAQVPAEVIAAREAARQALKNGNPAGERKSIAARIRMLLPEIRNFRMAGWTWKQIAVTLEPTIGAHAETYRAVFAVDVRQKAAARKGTQRAVRRGAVPETSATDGAKKPFGPSGL